MTGSSFASVNIRNSRILVVDDNRVNRHLLMAVLQRGGFPNVGTAEDGVDALAKIEESAPDLILLDLMMPRMDGEQFLQTLRASARASIPVVIVSGHTAATAKARELRADGCLAKPLELDDLLATVERFVRPSVGGAPSGDAR
jgi:phosphoserine phosphatase RsbU/P